AMHAVCHSVVVQVWPPRSWHVWSASGPRMLNHGILFGTEHDTVLSMVVPGGAEVNQPSPVPAARLVAFGRLASYVKIHRLAPTFVTVGLTKEFGTVPLHRPPPVQVAFVVHWAPAFVPPVHFIRVGPGFVKGSSTRPSQSLSIPSQSSGPTRLR